jgi:ribonuclease HI
MKRLSKGIQTAKLVLYLSLFNFKETNMAQFYGVWAGRNPGVYDNWNDCKAQVDKFSGAKYSKLKATTQADALIEFNKANGSATTASTNVSTPSSVKPSNGKSVPIENVLTVDGAANGICCEFQAVWYPSKELAFESKPLQGGTNNIAEFLGLVSAIKYLNEKNLPLRVYTDSVTAMAWVRNKVANTTARNTGKATEELDTMISKAEKYLRDNADILESMEILKWETKDWGEIPADYGRK